MDASLLGYMGLSLDEAAARARDIAATCRRHGGELTVCYHNSTLPGVRQRDHYRNLARDLAVGDTSAPPTPVAMAPALAAAARDR